MEKGQVCCQYRMTNTLIPETSLKYSALAPAAGSSAEVIDIQYNLLIQILRSHENVRVTQVSAVTDHWCSEKIIAAGILWEDLPSFSLPKCITKGTVWGKRFSAQLPPHQLHRCMERTLKCRKNKRACYSDITLFLEKLV